MKISYNWLGRLLKSDLTPDEMSKILTDIGLEVDGMEKIEMIRGGLEGVVVGEVLTCEDHPDSDHLHVTTVDTGGEAPLQIVCGAPNVAAGQKVIVATVGAVLYPVGETEGFKIKKSKIRGVESLGMICAEDEIGVGTAHDGIMVLEADAVPGTPAAVQLKIKSDWQIEIGLTPNRADAVSHYGVARDLAAYLRTHGRECELILPDVSAYSRDEQGRAIEVTVENSAAAPRYTGVTITGLKIAPSPEWMQDCLRAIGINPKNNVVDITNYILHELGQPLHAFDADKIGGCRIVVRNCAEGTRFVTLDGVERKLSADDLMICDDSKPMCIGGVFGGAESGVSDTTTSVFLESAYFNPVSIRKSARRHGLNTDASFRYERGADPNIAVYALKRAALLMKEYAGGRITSDITDVYPVEIKPFSVDIAFDNIDRLVGKAIPHDDVRRILSALEIRIVGETDGVLSVEVPTYRVDVQREADLIEDILRIYGYNNVEIPVRVNSTLSYAPKPDKDRLVNMTADMLTAMGMTEIMSNSLTKSSYYEGFESCPASACVKIMNPLSGDLGVMRQTLLFNAMEAVTLNVNHRNCDLKLYEFGNVYRYDGAVRESAEKPLAAYNETYKLGITVTGNASVQSWNGKAVQSDFFTLRGIVERILGRFGVDIYALRSGAMDDDLFSDGMTCDLNGKPLLKMGVVSGRVAAMFDVKQPVYFAELDFAQLIHATRKHKVQAEELNKFPEVRRDLALLVDSDVTFAALRSAAMSAERKLLRSVSLFDVYEGDKLPAGKKSYALGFVLEDRTQTMTDKAIEKIMANITRALEKAGAAVRG